MLRDYIRNSWTSLLKAMIGVVIAIVAFECLVRVSLIKTTGSANHPVWGRVYEAGTYIHGTEGYSWTRINSHGLRGPDIEDKTPGETRVMALGDSYTEAFQVADGETYCVKLEERLQMKDRAIRVINAGRSGASPAQYVHLANQYNQAFSPDIVTIQLTDSDFDNSELFSTTRNFYLKREGDAIRTVFNPNWRGSNPLIARFPFLEPLFEFSTLRLIGNNVKVMLASQSGPTDSKANVEKAFSNDDVVAWFVASMKARFKQPCIIHIARVPLNGEATASPIERSLERWSRTHGVTFISTRDAFAQFQKRSRQSVRGFHNSTPGEGHINAFGHELVASQASQTLAQILAASGRR